MSINKMGPPRINIPQDLIDILEDTYNSDSRTFQADTYEDIEQFVKYSKLYAKRVGKSFRHKVIGMYLTFQLIDKRSYTRSTLPREKN